MNARAATTLLLLLLLLHTLPASAQDVDLQWLDGYIEQGREDWQIPGMAVAVVKDDEVIYARGFGVRRLGEQAQVDENTLFGVASTTKAMTATTLAMLVDEGLLDWDDRVVEHMPEFKLSDPWVTEYVTVRDLLTHQVGVGRITGNRIQFMPERDPSEVIYRMRYHDFEQPFRQDFVYSNVMYTVAGELVPAITGTSWADFMRERIFDPLGMERSSTSIEDLDNNAAWPHQEFEREVRTIERRAWDNVAPSAAVNTSVMEMARWMRLQLGEPGVFEGNRLVSEEQMWEMHRPQVAQSVSNPYTSFAAYGLGWTIGTHRGYHILRHGGATDGMNTNLVLLPEKNLGVIVMTNTFNQFMTAVGNEVLDAFIDDTPDTDWHGSILDNYHEQYAVAMGRRNVIEARRVENTEPTLPLDAYAGTYADSLYEQLEVVEENGQLAIRFWDDENQVADLEHWHYDTFRAHWRNPAQREKFVWFDLNRYGEVGHLNVQWTLRPVLLQVGIYPTDYYRITRFERAEE